MDNKIICRVTPVTQTSITVVDENGNQLENVLLSNASEFSQTVYSLADKYEAKENIFLSGPKVYANGIVKIMEKENMKDYNFNDYKITVL